MKARFSRPDPTSAGSSSVLAHRSPSRISLITCCPCLPPASDEVGYSGAPRTLGFDESGRHIVEYVEGDVLMPFEPRDPISALHRVGKLLREFHDAAATFVPPNDAK